MGSHWRWGQSLLDPMCESFSGIVVLCSPKTEMGICLIKERLEGHFRVADRCQQIIIDTTRQPTRVYILLHFTLHCFERVCPDFEDCQLSHTFIYFSLDIMVFTSEMKPKLTKTGGTCFWRQQGGCLKHPMKTGPFWTSQHLLWGQVCTGG